MKVFWIDLFCGAGGTTYGISEANCDADVVACVNHDINAIKSHAENHPNCVHFTEDIRERIVIRALHKYVKRLRKKYPGCFINIWASVECTNYSIAKGGLPRDGDSRTLPLVLIAYVDKIRPDYLYIENVKEFLSWGPLDLNGRPESRTKGKDYLRWRYAIEELGYRYDYRLLNAANYGGRTIRTRYFGQFAKKYNLIRWPKPTHAEKPEAKDMFENGLKPWLPVRDVLDLQDEGDSVFKRKKCLVDKTWKRIYNGLQKFVPTGDKQFMQAYYGSSGQGISLKGPCWSVTTKDRFQLIQYLGNQKFEFVGSAINKPCGTLTCVPTQCLVTARFLGNRQFEQAGRSINKPCGTVVTVPTQQLITTKFLANYNRTNNCNSVNKPCTTILSNPKQALVSAFMDIHQGKSTPKSIDRPANTLTANPKLLLVYPKFIMDTNYNNGAKSIDKPAPTILACRKHHYLENPQWNSKGGSIEKPCFTLIARMDKMPPYLVSAVKEKGIDLDKIKVETPYMGKVIEFMKANGIVDIKMRLLNIQELLQIQGFPKDYKLIGTMTEKKKYVGNSVETNTTSAITEANYRAAKETIKKGIRYEYSSMAQVKS